MGLFGNNQYPLDRDNHPAHAQQPGGVVCNLFQQHGHCHHRVYDSGAAVDPSLDLETSPSDAVYEPAPAQDEGNSGAFQGRPGPGIPGDHEDVPGGRGQPSWLPGAPGGPDAHSDWPVPGVDSDPIHQPGRPGGPVGKALLMVSLLAHLRSSASEPHVSGHEPWCGPPNARFSDPRLFRGWLDLGPAKDDHDAHHRPQTAVQPEHDVVDDARIPGGLFHGVAQRVATVLDRF